MTMKIKSNVQEEIDVMLEEFGCLERAHDAMMKALAGSSGETISEANYSVIVGMADYLVAVANVMHALNL